MVTPPDRDWETNSEEQDTDVDNDDTNQEEVDDLETDDVEKLEGLKEEVRQERARMERISKKLSNQTKSKSSNSDLEQRLERMELKQEGYSPDVIDSIMELGGKAALKNPLLAKAIQVEEKQLKVERASETDGASQSGMKSNVSLDELKTMSSEEMEKHLPKAQSQ